MKIQRPVLARLLLLGVVMVWGSTFVLIKGALRNISPLLFNLLRMLIALPILAVVYRKLLPSVNRKVLAQGSLVGLCLGAGYQFQTAGLRITTASKSAFITGLCTALVPALLIFPGLRSKTSQPPGLGVLLGASAALSGLAFLVFPARTPWASLWSGINIGDVLTLAAAIFFAFQIVLIAKFSESVRFEHMSFIQIAAATMFMACTTPVFEHPHILWTRTIVLALAVTAILGTAAAFAVQSFAQEILPATTVALIMALEPVCAWITSYLFLGEHLSNRQTLGAVLIIVGILMAELLPKLSWPARSPNCVPE